IYPEGFVAFSFPEYVQPPYTFPNPSWPRGHDPSFVAVFLTAQSFVHVGDHRLSHVWYRTITRRQFDHRRRSTNTAGEESHASYDGHAIDDHLLDEITSNIHENAVGSRGFIADYALLVTWEQLGYGGQPRYLRLDQYNEVKKWQNTYQAVLATDEHRSYAIFNYAHVNYTSSTSAGTLRGRGGKQSAIVGFNGGNGTGFWHFPYSANGDSYKLAEFGSCLSKGQWMARIDEQILYAGTLQLSSTWLNMIGGSSINVSGPCFSREDHITIDHTDPVAFQINMVVARCFVPMNALFKVGLVTAQLARDGQSYDWVTQAYIFPPDLARSPLYLLNGGPATIPAWDWYQAVPTNLTITWAAANISTNPNSKVDIVLWGYWEDYIDRDFIPVSTWV
ncbi:unnamed protein product, partial [Soboliphyme baturini]|uniref:NIDO domain-containing protein n=1 Tax=Soboliphyme baturini TaxID=241478 RepID=A0A183J7F4_9BILA